MYPGWDPATVVPETVVPHAVALRSRPHTAQCRKLIAHRNAQRLLVSVQRGRQVYNVPMPLGAGL